MIRISVPFHESVPTDRTLSSWGKNLQDAGAAQGRHTYVTVLAETNLTAHISETYIFIPLRSPSLVEHDTLLTFFIRLTS